MSVEHDVHCCTASAPDVNHARLVVGQLGDAPVGRKARPRHAFPNKTALPGA